MTHTLSEQDYIEKFGEQEYLNLCSAAYTTMQECEEFKNDQPYCHCLAVYTRTDMRGDKKTVIVESTAHKILRAPLGEGHIMSAVDFGIVTLHISDEEMPDLALDRYNEYKKDKEKLNNQTP